MFQLIKILKILVDMQRIQLTAVVQIQLKNIPSYDNESVPKTYLFLILKPEESGRPMISKYIS